MPTRSRRTPAALLAVLMLALSGCSSVDLTDQWPALGEPTGWEPKAQVCLRTFAATTSRSAYTPMDCTAYHSYETFHVGRFTGDAAAMSTVPGSGHSAVGAAWTECDTKATEYLGAPWRDGKVRVMVSVPSQGNWESGARWFLCGVALTEGLFGVASGWDESVKGELARSPQFRLGCYSIPKSGHWTETPCGEPHNGEYVGSFVSTDKWDEVNDPGNYETHYRKCRSVVAPYVGVPDDGDLKYRTGSAFWPAPREQWDAGDHSIRCFLYLGEEKLTKSLKGGGPKALPIT